jgi:hypothetical protein
MKERTAQHWSPAGPTSPPSHLAAAGQVADLVGAAPRDEHALLQVLLKVQQRNAVALMQRSPTAGPSSSTVAAGECLAPILVLQAQHQPPQPLHARGGHHIAMHRHRL